VQSGIIVDAPGSRNIHLGLGADGKTAEYAGLIFSRKVTVSILKDGTLIVTRRGVAGVDSKGNKWVSQKVEIDGEQVNAFFENPR
jgi:siderophore synthetase component